MESNGYTKQRFSRHLTLKNGEVRLTIELYMINSTLLYLSYYLEEIYKDMR